MKNIYLYAFLLLVITGCKKTDHSYDHTFDSQGTFDAKVNGDWLSPCLTAEVAGGPINTYLSNYTTTDYRISVNAVNECTDFFLNGHSLAVFFDSVQLVVNTTYKLGSSKPGSISCVYANSKIFVSDINLPGTITILKFDPSSRIISASFEGTLRSEATGETASVANGLFDLKY